MELEADYVSEAVAHSHVGASGAPRWMNCHGSPNLIAKLGPKAKGSGIEAAKGTAAHTVLSTSLETKAEPWEMAGQTIEVGTSKFEVDDDMVKAVTICFDFITSLIAENPKAKFFVEAGLQHPVHEDLYGTTDFGMVLPKRLIVVDYKHGEGVTVEPDSAQLKYYAKLLLTLHGKHLTGNMPVDMYIVQPRIPHSGGLIRKETITVRELGQWFDSELLPAYEETKNPMAQLTVGEWCRFCPAREHCPALKREIAGIDTDLDPIHMTEDELGVVMMKADAIVAFLDHLKEEAFKRIVSGKKVPGYKLVRKKANRTWKRQAEGYLVETLGDAAYEPIKLASPAQVEKMTGGASLVARWAYTPDAGLTIAKESDKRPELKAALDLFLETNADLMAEVKISP